MGRVPRFLASPLSVRSIVLRIGLIASLFAPYGQIQASIILKACEINAVMKSNTVIALGFFSDPATASNLSEYAVMCVQYGGRGAHYQLGCSVSWGYILSTIGGYHEKCGDTEHSSSRY